MNTSFQHACVFHYETFGFVTWPWKDKNEEILFVSTKQTKKNVPSAWNWWSRRPTIHRLLEPPTPLWTSLNKQIKKKKNYLYIPKSQLKVLAPFRVDVTAVLGQDWAILCVLGSTGRRGPLSFFIIFRKSTANKNDGRCSYAKKRPDPLANWPLIFQQKIAWRCNSLRIDA